jgi:hypothetical protein
MVDVANSRWKNIQAGSRACYPEPRSWPLLRIRETGERNLEPMPEPHLETHLPWQGGGEWVASLGDRVMPAL